MIRLLHEQHVFSDRFITHMLARNIRIEEDLVDQLFNSSEPARGVLAEERFGVLKFRCLDCKQLWAVPTPIAPHRPDAA